MEEKKKKKEILKWMKEHKGLLITIGVISVTTVATIFAYKNWNAIKKLSESNPQTTAEAIKIINELPVPITKSPPINIDLSGDKYSATELGRLASVSNRNINKRLCEAGLQEKSGNGYIITEYGKHFGEYTCREQKSGFVADINIWCKGVLKVIFTPEEIQNINAHHKHVMEVLPNSKYEMI